MARTVSDFLVHPVSCIGSSVAGSIFYFLSPSFKNQLAKEKSLSIAAYIFLCLSVPVSMLLVGKWGPIKHPCLRTSVYCLVFTGTTLYSFRGDGYESMLDLFSYGAFSLAALSISRKIDFGFEVGMFSFFLQSAMATAFKMKNNFILSGTLIYCGVLIGIRFYLEYSQREILDFSPPSEIRVDNNPVHSNSPHQVDNNPESNQYGGALCNSVSESEGGDGGGLARGCRADVEAPAPMEVPAKKALTMQLAHRSGNEAASEGEGGDGGGLARGDRADAEALAPTKVAANRTLPPRRGQKKSKILKAVLKYAVAAQERGILKRRIVRDKSKSSASQSTS